MLDYLALEELAKNKFELGDFPGAIALYEEIIDGITKKLVDGEEFLDDDGKAIYKEKREYYISKLFDCYERSSESLANQHDYDGAIYIYQKIEEYIDKSQKYKFYESIIRYKKPDILLKKANYCLANQDYENLKLCYRSLIGNNLISNEELESIGTKSLEIGDIYLNKKQYNEAREWYYLYEKVNNQGLVKIADSYYLQGDYENSFINYNDYRKIYLDNAYVFDQISVIIDWYLANQDYDKAKFCYRLLINDTFTSNNFFHGITQKSLETGDMFLEQQQYEEAREWYDIYENLDSRGLGLVKIADSYYKQHNYEKSFENYIKCYEKSLQEAEVFERMLSIGDLYFEQKKYPQAILAYQKVKESVPNEYEDEHTPKVVQRLISIHSYLEQYDKAIELCVDLIENYPNTDNMYELIRQIAQEQVESAKEKLGLLIAGFSHSLTNTLAPQYLEEVMNTLKKRPELRDESLLLAKAWSSEILIRQQGALLEMKYKDPVQFRNVIAESFTIEPQETIITLYEILNWSTERVIERFLNKEYQKLKETRKIILRQSKKSLNDLKGLFEKEVFFEQQLDALTWAKQHLLPITYTTTEVWQILRVKKESFTEIFLKSYFAELLLNSLKYYQKGDWARINFGDDETYLIMTWQNDLITPPESSEGRGLDSIRNDLQILNENATPYKDIDIVMDSQIFQVTLYLAKPLILRTL